MSDAPATSESTQTVNAALIGCTDGLGARDWKAYRRIWNKTHPKSLKAAQKKLRTKKHEQGEIVNQAECKCTVCKSVFNRDEAHLRGYRFLSRYVCVCDECA